jgi:hypothetical protein
MGSYEEYVMGDNGLKDEGVGMSRISRRAVLGVEG